jgi:hypothetical protein
VPETGDDESTSTPGVRSLRMDPQFDDYGSVPEYHPQDRPRTGAIGIVAGLVALLAAGAMGWVVYEWYTAFDESGTPMPNQLWVVVGVRAALVVLLIGLGVAALARRVAGAWLLVVVALLAVATLVLEPLVLRLDVGGWVELMVELRDSFATAIVLASALGLLTALLAIAAGSTRADGRPG